MYKRKNPNQRLSKYLFAALSLLFGWRNRLGVELGKLRLWLNDFRGLSAVHCARSVLRNSLFVSLGNFVDSFKLACIQDSLQMNLSMYIMLTSSDMEGQFSRECARIAVGTSCCWTGSYYLQSTCWQVLFCKYLRTRKLTWSRDGSER